MAEECFVLKTFREVYNSGHLSNSFKLSKKTLKQQQQGEQTLIWFDNFVEFFITPTPLMEDEHDDILYFIQDCEPVNIFVKRRVTAQVPKLEGLVRWEETFYVNLIARMYCLLRVTICDGDLMVKRQAVRRVYPEPTVSSLEKETNGFQSSFPLIFFTIHDSEDFFHDFFLEIGHSLCVELCNVVNNNICMVDEQPVKYNPWCNDEEKLVLFQGAVGYDSLLKVHTKKTGLRKLSTTPQSILMRGPKEQGMAQVQVSNTENGLRDRFRRFFTNNVGDDDDCKRTSLRCKLSFINMDWQQIIQGMVKHFL